MQPSEVISQMPYPIASVYADLENPQAPPQMQREAVYFTAYQLMRTVGLTLVGQYLTQPLPEGASYRARQSLNRAIVGIRCPHFSDWITLLNTLHKYHRELGLDFFPEFEQAMEAVRQSKVDVPPAYGLDYGTRCKGLTWLEAMCALRNSVAHSGMGRDEVCREAVRFFRPILEQLLDAFAFLKDYELLALRSSLDDDPTLVQVLRGATPPEAESMELDDALYRAFEVSPVVMRAPTGTVQALFPLFHGHIEGEPLHCYDGHYLRDDPKMQRRTIYYLGTEQRLPLDDTQAINLVRPPAPSNAGERLLKMLQAREIPWHMRREEVAPWTLRDTVNDYARRTLDDMIGIKYLPSCYLDRPALSATLWDFVTAERTQFRAFLLSGRAGSGKTALLCD